MNSKKEFRRSARLMGSAFEFIIVSEDRLGEKLLDMAIAEVQRIEKMLTEFSDDSETASVNRLAGMRPAMVSEETFLLIERCLKISKLSQGAFDITASLLKHLYPFRDRAFEFPNEETIRQALRKVGYGNIVLRSPKSVYLKIPGMRIGFGAIGKGYAADKVKTLMTSEGVSGGVINSSGDLTAWGTKANGENWKVGISDPNFPEKIMMWLPLRDQSIATSGDYEQFFERNGIRYSHTIDPKSGKPTTGVKSATVVSASAELADALATALFIMGCDVGIHFANQLPDTYAIMVDDTNTMFTSRNLNLILKQE